MIDTPIEINGEFEVEISGEPNVIEEVKVNGEPVEVVDRAVDITVPTKLSELENDSNFTTKEELPVVPTKLSELENDTGYLTSYEESDPVFNASPAKNITEENITSWNNKSEFSGSYNDLIDKPEPPVIPTKVSELENDSNFVDKQYVTDSINAIDITDPDLSNYLAKDNATEFTPDADYEPATKKYVDDSLSNVGITLDDEVTETSENGVKSSGIFKSINLNTNVFFFDNNTPLPSISASYANSSVSKMVSDLLSLNDNTKISKALVVGKFNDNTFLLHPQMFTIEADGILQLIGVGIKKKSLNNIDGFIPIIKLQSGYTYDETTNAYTANSRYTIECFTDVAIHTQTSANNCFLNKTNTTEFTPTSDYNPATKKYVDDQIGDISMILTTLTTVSEVTE